MVTVGVILALVGAISGITALRMAARPSTTKFPSVTVGRSQVRSRLFVVPRQP